MRDLDPTTEVALGAAQAVHHRQLQPPNQTVQARACIANCAGATPAPAPPTYSRHNAENAPASEARRASAGADASGQGIRREGQPLVIMASF
jgi:hypothetical protein